MSNNEICKKECKKENTCLNITYSDIFKPLTKIPKNIDFTQDIITNNKISNNTQITNNTRISNNNKLVNNTQIANNSQIDVLNKYNSNLFTNNYQNQNIHCNTSNIQCNEIKHIPKSIFTLDDYCYNTKKCNNKVKLNKSSINKYTQCDNNISSLFTFGKTTKIKKMNISKHNLINDVHQTNLLDLFSNSHNKYNKNSNKLLNLFSNNIDECRSKLKINTHKSVQKPYCKIKKCKNYCYPNYCCRTEFVNYLDKSNKLDIQDKQSINLLGIKDISNTKIIDVNKTNIKEDTLFTLTNEISKNAFNIRKCKCNCDYILDTC